MIFLEEMEVRRGLILQSIFYLNFELKRNAARISGSSEFSNGGS